MYRTEDHQIGPYGYPTLVSLILNYIQYKALTATKSVYKTRKNTHTIPSGSFYTELIATTPLCKTRKTTPHNTTQHTLQLVTMKTYMFTQPLLQGFDLSLSVLLVQLHGATQLLSGGLGELQALLLGFGHHLLGLLPLPGQLFQALCLKRL